MQVREEGSENDWEKKDAWLLVPFVPGPGGHSGSLDDGHMNQRLSAGEGEKKLPKKKTACQLSQGEERSVYSNSNGSLDLDKREHINRHHQRARRGYIR